MPEDIDPWSGIEVFWDYVTQGSKLTIGISGPAFLLKRFESPTDVMIAFMQAVAATDQRLMIGAMDSIHTRFTPTGFAATWVGTVVDVDGQIPVTMRKITKALGGTEL